MPFWPNTNDIIEVKVMCYQSTQMSVNVRHYIVDVPFNGDRDYQMLADRLSAKWAPFMKALLAENANYVGLKMSVISPTPTAEFTSLVGAGPGTRTGTSLSPQSAGLVTLRSLEPGRSKRGRLYMPFPSEEDNVSTGYPSTTYVTDLQTVGDWIVDHLVLTGVGADTCTLASVVWSRTLGTAARIESSNARTAWATQRRRSYINRADMPL